MNTEKSLVNLYKKIHAILSQVGPVRKDQDMDGVQFVSEAAVKDALRPFFIDQGLIGHVVGSLIQSFGSVGKERIFYTLTYRIANIEDGAYIDIPITQKIEDHMPAGAAVTMAEKHALKTSFMLNTYEDSVNALEEKQISEIKLPPAVSPGEIKSQFKTATENAEMVNSKPKDIVLPKEEAKIVELPKVIVSGNSTNMEVSGKLSKKFDSKEFDQELMAMGADIYRHPILLEFPFNIEEALKIISKNRTTKLYRILISAFVIDKENDDQGLSSFWLTVKKNLPGFDPDGNVEVVPVKEKVKDTYKYTIPVPDIEEGAVRRTMGEYSNMIEALDELGMSPADVVVSGTNCFLAGLIGDGQNVYDNKDKAPGRLNAMVFLTTAPKEEIFEVIKDFKSE